MDLPGHNPVLAPGMSQVITAGEAYVITDDKGKELELIGKEPVEVIAFCRAFHFWLGLRRSTGDSEVTQHAWHVLMGAYENLPSHIKKELLR